MSSPCNECRYCPQVPSEETRRGWVRACYKDHLVAAPLVRRSRKDGKGSMIYVVPLEPLICPDRDVCPDPTRFERILESTD